MNILGNNNSNQTFQAYWASLPFGYKFFFIATLLIWTISLVFPSISLSFISVPALVIHKYQVYRLFLPFLATPSGLLDIVNILINFYWFLNIWPSIQKKYSTIYIFVQILLQNIILQIIFTVGVFFECKLFATTQSSFHGFGWFPMVLTLIWEKISQAPQSLTNFCCLPCLIPQKYIPWIILGIVSLLSPGLFTYYFLACFLGWLQYFKLNRKLITVSFKRYKQFEQIFAKAINNRSDFVSVESVKSNLRAKCMQPSSQLNSNNEQSEDFMFNQNISGQSIKIGSSSREDFYQVNYREAWVKKAEQMQLKQIVKNEQSTDSNTKIQKKFDQSNQEGEESSETNRAFISSRQESG